MLSTFIIENFAVVRVLLLVALIVAIAGVGLLVRLRSGRLIAAIIAGLALVVVLGLTLTPDTYPLDVTTCNLESQTPLGDYLNIFLFVVPALFAVVATRRPVIVLFSGILLSAVIEFVQFSNPAFGRRCDIDDWLANSFGTLLGVAIAWAVTAAVRALIARRAASVSH